MNWQHGWLALCLMLLALCLMLTTAGCRSSQPAVFAAQERSPLLGHAGPHSKIVALGRVRLEVPETADASINKAVLSDVTVRWQVLPGLGDFKSAVAARTQELRKPEGTDGPPLLKIFDLNAQHRVAFLRREFPGQDLQVFELWQESGNHALVASAPMMPYELALVQGDVMSVANAFVPATEKIAAEKGFGVDGGVVQRAFLTNETLDADVRLPLRMEATSRTLASLNVVTDVLNKDAKATLLARVAEEEGAMMQLMAASHGASLRHIRKGKRTVCGLAGEEVVTRIAAPAERPGITGHAEFDFGGEARNPLRPSLQITLDDRDLANETEFQQFMAVWDRLLQSLQMYA